MKKQEQISINKIVIEKYESFFNNEGRCAYRNEEDQLDHCSATIGETPNYYYLRSYNTIVALVDKNTGRGYDFLRFVYGYTATSAKHISKFFRYKAITTFTFRPV